MGMISDKNPDIAVLKHELIHTKGMLDASEKTVRDLKNELDIIERKRDTMEEASLIVKEREASNAYLRTKAIDQVKRIHEYKRQLLNILYTIHRYLTIKDTPVSERS